MSSNHLFKSLAFRVYMRPAPKAQSEVHAVLRVLQEFGPVSAFQIPRHRLVQDKHGVEDSAEANLVFGSTTKTLDGILAGGRSKTFSVTANADTGDPKLDDPFNIRGLQGRKPALPPQRIRCTVIPLEEHGDEKVSSVLEELKNNEYRDSFAVDRNSIFGEILAKTDCPSGLIHGLLPRTAMRRRAAVESRTSPSASDDMRRSRDHQLDSKAREIRRVDRDVEPVPSKLDNHEGSKDGHEVKSEARNTVSQPKNQPVDEPLDKYEHLRKVSLMQMYREAISRTGRQPEKARKTAHKTNT